MITQQWKRILTSHWLPWMLVGTALLVTVADLTFQPAWSRDLPRSEQLASWALGILGLLLVYLTLSALRELGAERHRLEQRLSGAEARLEEAYRQMESLFRVGQKFVDAVDENQVIEPVLRLMIELTGATGAAFVPIDEHGQPQTALSQGDLPFPIQEAWFEYLTTDGVRDRCRKCEAREPVERPDDCPLLRGPFAHSEGLICLPVRRGEREFGVMNLFLAHKGTLEPRTRALVGALLDEAALGLDGVYLRRRELSALRQLQLLRQKTDLTALLNGLLENVSLTLGADFAVMITTRRDHAAPGLNLVEGDLPASARPFIDGLLHGVIASSEPVLLGDLAGDPGGDGEARPYLTSIVAAPLLSSEQGVLGAILVGNRHGHGRQRGFQPRQLALLQTIAGQVALVVQNASLMAELEYRTMVQERARLAREIHDGLAQTIGFLKLQAAQLRNYLGRDDLDRARRAADTFYATLTEAYQDARQAIDGLRISPDECGLDGWLTQTAAEFQEISGLPVHLGDVVMSARLSPEIQAQLIRIVQEALSNVRKHAQAEQVWIVCHENSGDVLLEVRDDGRGFSPEDVSGASQHGLRGMRERAELIGADFQVVSRPQGGATVRVRLPLRREQEVGKIS